MFDTDLNENVKQPIEEDLEEDSDNSDFIGGEEKDSDEVSLDEESVDNKVLDELDFEANIEQMML